MLSLTYHVLTLGKDSEERIVPLLDVNVQEPGTWQGATAGATHMSVHWVVVVFILLQWTEDCTAARDVTGKLWHTKIRRVKKKIQTMGCHKYICLALLQLYNLLKGVVRKLQYVCMYCMFIYNYNVLCFWCLRSMKWALSIKFWMFEVPGCIWL